MNFFKAVRQLSTSTACRKDLVSDLFLKQIRELAAKQKAAGGSLARTSPDIKKQLDEQLNRLANKFQIPNADVVGKLTVDFEKPNLESSVAAVVEGKSLDAQINEVKTHHAEFVKASEAKKKAEQERQAAVSA